MNNNNIVNLVGTIESKFVYSNTVANEDFYMFSMAIKRASGYIDKLPVMVSSRIFDITMDMSGARVEINGSFRSFNMYSNNGRKSSLILYVFADTIQETDKEDYNTIWIEGFLCRKPTYRQTPLGREISDVLMAVNRTSSTKSDYLPAVVWGRNAAFISGFEAGTKLSAYGRIQSREYMKPIGDGKETRIAYEVSASRIDVCTAAGGGGYECDEAPGEPEVLQ